MFIIKVYCLFSWVGVIIVAFVVVVCCLFASELAFDLGVLVAIACVALLVFGFVLWLVICVDLLLFLVWLVLVIVVCADDLFAVFDACRILLGFACGFLGLLCGLTLLGCVHCSYVVVYLLLAAAFGFDLTLFLHSCCVLLLVLLRFWFGLLF